MEHISDIYFVGGFGTVQWVDVAQFESVLPDPINRSTDTSSPEMILSELSKKYVTLQETLKLFYTYPTLDTLLMATVPVQYTPTHTHYAA